MNIDNWKEFKVGELFDATRGKSRRMQILEDGDIPLIAAARNNRGIAGTYNIDAEYENAITVSCNGVGCGSTFYHNYPFSITGDAIVLEEKQDMSDYIKQFIASIIDASFTNKYSYEEKCSADKAKNETILLPATPSGDPDWVYMEAYMKEMEEKAKERLDRLEEMRKVEEKKIDVTGWGEFKVGELFDVYLSKDDIQPKHLQEGDTPLISSGKEKNGITAYITDDDAQLWDANTLTVDMFGKVFYQNAPYYCVSHGRVNILYPKTKLNEKILLFIASVIEQVSVNKYNFTDMCTAGKIKNDVLLLPVTSAGAPDWTCMEQYMKEMEEKAKKRLEKLSKS